MIICYLHFGFLIALSVTTFRHLALYFDLKVANNETLNDDMMKKKSVPILLGEMKDV